MNEIKYFKVTCKCGHVGKKYFIRVEFPLIAHSKKDAAAIARYLPRVKHDHKDAILNCEEINLLEFENIKRKNNDDPYLKCANIQDQRNIINFESRLELEPKYKFEDKKANKKERAKFRLKKNCIIEDSLKEYEKEVLHGLFTY